MRFESAPPSCPSMSVFGSSFPVAITNLRRRFLETQWGLDVLDQGSFFLLVLDLILIGTFAGLSISSLFLQRSVVVAPFFGVD